MASTQSKNPTATSQKTPEKSRKALLQELEAKEAELSRAAGELKQTRKELKERIAQIEALEQKNQELVNSNQALLEENETLKKRLETMARNHERELEAAKRELRETERQCRQLEKELDDLKRALSEYKEGLNRQAASSATSKGTFLVHFYRHEGEFHGRIEHPATQDKKILHGLDRDALMQFIEAHLPAAAARPAAVPKARDTKAVPQRHADPTSAAPVGDCRVQVLASEMRQPALSSSPILGLDGTQEFELETRFRLEGKDAPALTQQKPSFRVTWYLVSLVDGQSTLLGSAEGQLQSNQLEYEVRQTLNKPLTGEFRLITVVTFPGVKTLMGHRQGPAVHFAEPNVELETA